MNSPKESYPLYWPDGRQRIPKEKRVTGRFKSSFAAARDGVIAEIRRLGGKDTIVSTNLPLKRNGDPQAIKWGETIPDPGVAVYFMRNGKQFAFCCDGYNHIQDNMQAITLTISALRGIARWGTGDMMEAAFRGFTAIPEKTGGITWWDVLGVSINASEEQINDSYREKAKTLHPDVGGDHEKMVQLNEAYRAATSQRVT